MCRPVSLKEKKKKPHMVLNLLKNYSYISQQRKAYIGIPYCFSANAGVRTQARNVITMCLDFLIFKLRTMKIAMHNFLDLIHLG